MRHAPLASIALLVFGLGCARDHTTDPCPPIADDTCYAISCCADRVDGTVNERTCALECPAGYTDDSRGCAMACSLDGGSTRDAGPADAGVDAGATPDWAACDEHFECRLSARGCCGVCAGASLDEFDGVNRARLEEHRDDLCPPPLPACAPCEESYVPEPNYLALCLEGACTPVDLRESGLSLCTSDEECVVRRADCCQCGDALVALPGTSRSDYDAIVCDPAADCPDCGRMPPVGVQGSCVAGHCVVEPLLPPEGR